MTSTTLFGIYLAPLYAAIAHVESDNGKTSPNVYQLTSVYVSDCNRICGGTYDENEKMWTGGKYDFKTNDRYLARWVSEKMMLVCWDYYGKVYEKSGNAVTAEFLANVHRYGYHGAKAMMSSGIETPYWNKVSRYYENLRKEK